MLRRMIVPAGFAAVLGLLASAALADGEKRTTVQDENRVESFDRTIEPPRRAAVRAPPSHRRMAVYAHVIMPMGGMPIVPSIHGAATTVSIPAAICSSPASPRHGLPGIVNVATVTYRTHVYDTPAYPSAILRLPAVTLASTT